MSKDIEIILVRHGETTYNVQRLVHGQRDISLTENGRFQAILAGQRLKREQKVVDAVWSSDLSRCKETAQLILSQNDSHKDLVVRSEPRIRERHRGELEGMPIGAAHRKVANEGKEYCDYGESRELAAEGYTEAWDSILEQSAAANFQRVLVVSHSMVIVRLITDLMDRPNYSFGEFFEAGQRRRRVGQLGNPMNRHYNAPAKSATDDNLAVPPSGPFTIITYNPVTKAGVFMRYADASHC